MMKFLIGALCGGLVVYYAEHRSLETEKQIKTEVNKRAPVITQLSQH